MISYAPLWRTMKKKGVSTYRLNKEGISRGTIYCMQHGEGISTYTVDKLCRILSCSVNDIIEYIDPDAIPAIEEPEESEDDFEQEYPEL